MSLLCGGCVRSVFGLLRRLLEGIMCALWIMDGYSFSGACWPIRSFLLYTHCSAPFSRDTRSPVVSCLLSSLKRFAPQGFVLGHAPTNTSMHREVSSLSLPEEESGGETGQARYFGFVALHDELSACDYYCVTRKPSSIAVAAVLLTRPTFLFLLSPRI